MAKLSIITPVYKTEQYLDKCLTSLINQTLSGIELILVDNGASPACQKIMEKYASLHPFIKIIRLKENIGYSGAMNEGLKIAAGEYIGFCDSDDYVDNDYYEKLYLKAKETNSDIVCTCYKEEHDSDHTIIPHRLHTPLLTDNKTKIKALQNGATWNKIYKRSMLKKNQITFPNLGHSFAVDNGFLLLAVLAANQLCLIDAPYYHYVQHQSSEMHQKLNKKEKLSKLRTVIEYILSKINMLDLSSQTKYELASFFVRSLNLSQIIKDNAEYALLEKSLNDPELKTLFANLRKALCPSWQQKLFSVQDCFNKRIFWLSGIKIKLKAKDIY